MDIRLIRANIALADGDRLEVMRLLAEYRREHPAADDNEALLLWLEAHAQTDHHALVRHLDKLLKQTVPDDRYHQMARDYLWQEDNYASYIADVQHQARAVPGLSRRRFVIAAVLIVAFIALISSGVRWMNQAEPTVIVPTAIVFQATPLPTPLPDNSVRLNLNDHTRRYEGGLLQIAALEDNSQRVVDSITGEFLTPVEGARFYGLQLYFECRQGICDEPPQAILTLALENDFVVSPRDGAVIQGGGTMQPLALGRRTEGWVVFEVPVISHPLELVVTPLDLQGRNEPVTIPLPPPDAP